MPIRNHHNEPTSTRCVWRRTQTQLGHLQQNQEAKRTRIPQKQLLFLSLSFEVNYFPSHTCQSKIFFTLWCLAHVRGLSLLSFMRYIRPNNKTANRQLPECLDVAYSTPLTKRLKKYTFPGDINFWSRL